MDQQSNNIRTKWAQALDWGYYILILATIVVFFITRSGKLPYWDFLAPAVLAVIVRVASLILKQKKGEKYD